MSRLNKAFIVTQNNVPSKKNSFKYARNIIELIVIILKCVLSSDWLWIEIEEDKFDIEEDNEE